ncbi:DnaJ domain-containing protein [Mucilaginibacter sp. AW1-3]
MDFKNDYYRVLGISREATAEQIKKAYRILAKKYHPDLHPDNAEYGEKIRLVNEAYEVLGNNYTRFVYDHYQASAPAAEPKANSRNQRSYTQKTTVTEEEKLYMRGTLFIKFRGRQNDDATGDVMKEVVYDLRVTDARAVIRAGDIYREAVVPQSYLDAMAGGNKGAPVPQPIRSTVVSASGESHYELDILELTLGELIVDNVTKDDGDSFSSLHAEFYGYVKHLTTHEQETIVTECYGETGRKEQKTENGRTYRRREYYHQDCNTYWSNWIPDYVPPPPRRNTAVRPAGCLPSLAATLRWVYLGFFLIYFFAKLYFIIPFLAIAGLFWLISAQRWVWLFRTLGIFLFGLFIFSLIGAFHYHPTTQPVVREQAREQRPYRSDSLITYYRNWMDYEGHRYEGQYTMRKSAFVQAKNYKNSLTVPYDEMLYDLSFHDQNKLNGLYQLLDSIHASNQLSPRQFAETMVSMVQDIPYAVVLPQACDANLYTDQFISTYLASPNAQCDGNEKYGINTPVEFLATLKGDCDTRTLLLYTMLAHYGYDIALLSSEHYSHSLIGINLPYDGARYEKYTLWETTSFFKPGILPNEISDLSYWRISLKSAP